MNRTGKIFSLYLPFRIPQETGLQKSGVAISTIPLFIITLFFRSSAGNRPLVGLVGHHALYGDAGEVPKPPRHGANLFVRCLHHQRDDIEVFFMVGYAHARVYKF